MIGEVQKIFHELFIRMLLGYSVFCDFLKFGFCLLTPFAKYRWGQLPTANRGHKNNIFILITSLFISGFCRMSFYEAGAFV